MVLDIFLILVNVILFLIVAQNLTKFFINIILIKKLNKYFEAALKEREEEK